MNKKYNFTGYSCCIIDTNDNHFHCDDNIHLVGETETKARYEYINRLKSRYGYDKLIRDICIKPYTEPEKTIYEQMTLDEIEIENEKEKDEMRKAKVFDKDLKVIITYPNYQYEKDYIDKQVDIIIKTIISKMNNHSDIYRKQIKDYIDEWIKMTKAPFTKKDITPFGVEILFDKDYLDITEKEYEIYLVFKIKDKDIGIKCIVQDKALYNMFYPINPFSDYINNLGENNEYKVVREVI